jgi:hypothetical protein
MGNTMDPEKSPIISITLWQFNIAIENGPVEIVDLPSYKMVDLSIVMWLFTRGCIYIYTYWMILVGISPYIIPITTNQQGFGSLGHCLLQRRGVQTGFAHKRLVNVGHILRHGHMQFAGGFFSIF